MYAEVTIIVDGALEDTITFTDECAMDDALDGFVEDAQDHGYPTHIDVRYHDHPLGECECAQYETDHAPAIVINDPGVRQRWDFGLIPRHPSEWDRFC